MIKTLLTPAIVLALGAGANQAQNPFESQTPPAAQTQIDKLVFANLKRLGITPAVLCTDAVFVRRAYLDVIGTLPTAREAKAFIEDNDPQKRGKLIDRLLARDEFADYWALKWGDILRIRAEFPINLWPNAAQAYHRWVRDSLREDMPYDRFVREILTANGSNFRVGQVNFYRAMQDRSPEGIARAVALTFMGTRAEKWPSEQLAGMAEFFTKIGYKNTGEWKEQIVFFDPNQTATQENTAAGQTETNVVAKIAPRVAAKPAFPDGTPVKLAPNRDPRVVFADWLISPKNPWFARNIVNRIWSWLLGRGIIHEPDDIRPDNPPVNPELLAYLESELVAARYDLKHIYRLILNSQTYQLSSVPKTRTPEAEANFAFYPLRRLEAEVLIDALNQITGTTEKYSSEVPEPFTFVPEEQRSISLPDASITSSFLEMFGRPARNTGLESERSNKPTTDQRLHFLNSSHIQRKIENSPKLQTLFASAAPGKPPKVKPSRTSKPKKGARAKGSVDTSAADNAGKQTEFVNELYLTVLSRFPTPDELKVVAEYMQTASSKREAAVDLTWALFNSAEFLYRH
ncbi:MAG: DUF1549 and DUF1553 domain-containing protein [Verrucomicrobiae bacterium]|nr:DUF1549 and DUF1553 domain-containing protein [Verrucomicrobiae bacterium]